MARERAIVRLSSKGQLVIPAGLRRQLGLRAGQTLALRRGADREIVITPAEAGSETLEAALRRARAWTAAKRRDLVEELHQRRRREREHRAGGR